MTTPQNEKIINYLTVDVEDYYHVSAFEKHIPYAKWDKYESRVEVNTKKILDMLGKYGEIKATFFVLGWVAKRFPSLVKEIDKQGHIVACHSFRHQLVYRQTPDEFRKDLIMAKEILEDIIGKKVTGYRAPSCSITNKSLFALKILKENGFDYDSSIFPIHHDRYGIPDSHRFPYIIPEYNLWEYPLSTVNFMGKNIPVSGGGYFRFFPYPFIYRALKKINTKEKEAFIFYIHPWEFDPDQPKVSDVNFLTTFRHYNNLKKTQKRFSHLLQNFNFQPIRVSAK